MKRLILIFILFARPGVSFAQNADIDILKEINLGRSESTDQFCRAISNSVAPVVVIVPIGLITYALVKKDSASKSKAILVTGSLLISGAITTTLKYTVQRPRPFETYSFIEQKTPVHGYSFPSGHTSNAFALATSMSIAYPKWYVIAPSYLWAGAVGYSRMELGVHYPSDVLAGAVIGSGSVWLSWKLNKWINKKSSRR